MSERSYESEASVPVPPADVPVSKLRLDAGTQMRVDLDQAVVEVDARLMRAGTRFPPIEVVREAGTGALLVVDGFHRALAALAIGSAAIPAVVTKDTRAGAVWRAAGANVTHGLRRANADKARAGKTALRLRPELSDRVLSEHVGVESTTMSRYRAELVAEGELPSTQTTVGRDGKRRTYDRGDRIAKGKVSRAAKLATVAATRRCPHCHGTGRVPRGEV